MAQGAFVKGRQILDVVLVANEIVEEYRSSRNEGILLRWISRRHMITWTGNFWILY